MNEKLKNLFEAARADFDLNGFVGCDYNMAVMCICAKKTGIQMNFMTGGGSYESKLEYWASKRNFGHLQVSSEDDLIQHAMKEYKIS